MITFDTYREILASLSKAGIHSRRIDSLHTAPPAAGSLFLKHDVEARMERAVRMAGIEAEEGHKATYYFQGDLLKAPDAEQQIRAIKALGHEIAYHYDVLDANDGDYDTANQEFAAYLDQFAAFGAEVTTVCPHGNPTKVRNGWKSNKDFFRASEVRARYKDMIDIVIDFPALFPKGLYLSDAGLNLRLVAEIAGDKASNPKATNDGQKINWESVAELVQGSSGVVLSAHSHRFLESRRAQQAQRLKFFILKKSYMVLKHVPLVKRLTSRFYKLTRKI